MFSPPLFPFVIFSHRFTHFPTSFFVIWVKLFREMDEFTLIISMF
jgi:hypothetical protein